ncbi:hypothetical protein [Micromonospora sicca]|uniref:Uncharacterized protein n=1 Tax=Micromonospora sicca TaxID=2202420 RepID=A0ABU5JFZ1_9ACTN|nr:hypothetical protein [Micromonospora sp. 4G53]MDZ5491508.1 hypothetical protein [Micromonospora sp. 4G53]
METISALPLFHLAEQAADQKDHAEGDEQEDGEQYADPSGEDIHG